MSSIVRLSLFVGCGVIGYLAGGALSSQKAVTKAPTVVAVVKDSALVDNLPPATAAESALIAEWEQLKASRGGDAADLSALFLEIKDLKDSFRRRAFRSALLADWNEKDPQAALTFLGKKDPGMASQLIREWLRKDPNAAVTALLAAGTDQQGNLRGVLNDIAKAVPERLAEVVSSLPKAQGRWDTKALDAFAIYARKDPAAARAAAESVTGPMRGQALAGVAGTWAEKDGEAALTWAQALPPGDDRDKVLKATLVGWAKTDPIAALGKIDLVPPGGDDAYYNSDTGAQVLREAGKRDWDGTLRWLRENPGKLGQQSVTGLQDALSHRLQIDPTGTMRSIASSGVAGLEWAFANSVLNEGYAQRDAVWSWLDGQPANEFTKRIRGSLLNAIAWKDPEVALTYMEKLADSPDNRQALQNGARSLLNGGSQMERFDGLLETCSAKIRPLLVEAGFECGIRESVNDADRWLKLLNELPEDRRTLASTELARGWAATDPEAAMKWVETLPNGPSQRSAFASAASGWAATDVYEASDWINTLPAGEKRDVATQGLVQAISNSQPEMAWNWAMSIGDEGIRSSTLQLAYIGLQQRDPNAAKQMLESANLSPQLVERLRKSHP